MPLCLYECLKAAGLKHHYARFTSVGVHRAAHLSLLTMEDYPTLGISSMEDRTRLFHLVQMVKTLDLEYEDDDNNYDADVGDEGYVVADRTFVYDGCGDPDEDVYHNDDADEKGAAVSKINSTGVSKPLCVRRRLDFRCETIDHHLKPCPCPEGTVHVYTRRIRNNVPGQGEGSAIPVQLDTGSVEVFCCKGNNNHGLDFHSHQSDQHTGANTVPNIKEENSLYKSYSRLSPKCVSFHKPKPRPVTLASNRFSNQPAGHKDRKGICRGEKLYTKSHRATKHTAKPTPVYESKKTTGYNYGLPLSSSAPNKKQPGGQRISVCVRKRPLTHTECRRGEADVVTTPSAECVIVHESKEAVDLSEYILQHRFYFDQVFGEESSNVEVYQRTAYPLVRHMLNGGKATCFAYGQTGAGKTHTMLGSPVMPGLYSLAVQDIFAHLSTTHMHSRSLVYVSFFEIYCGQLYDLLDHRKRLFAREDGQNVVHIVGLCDVKVDSVSSLLEVISQGTEERTQGMSGVNPLSSRSHALLQIQLRDPNQQIFGRMWFVDLAGSERASDTKKPDKQSRMEGAEINQSLLALKECIRSLDQEQSHTPFRQSKLTQVLKDSFVGDSMTCMIANISPGHLATEHTLNTLRYADRVKELRGQGGLRGGRSSKTIPFPKQNLSNSGSSSGGNSIGTRGKSPPKKPKLRREREDFRPTTPPMTLPTGTSILCSTPKNSIWPDKTSASARKGIGLEHITPVRGLLELGDKTERAVVRKGKRRERYEATDSEDHLAGDHNIVAELVLGQATDEQTHLWEVQKKSGFHHKERQNQPCPLERGGKEERRQVESSRDTCSEVESLRERDLQKVDKRNKEKERHLRQYHQQLQCMPSSASSSAHLFTPSTVSSLSSSNRASFSSSVSPFSSSCLQLSSHLSVSDLINHGFEAYRARVEVRANGNRGQSSSFPSGEICLETETTPSYNKNKDAVAHSNVAKEVPAEGREARFGDRGKHDRRRSLRATGKGESVSRELGPAVIEEEERRWATTTETKRADRMTGALPADVEALVSYNCDSEECREVGEEGLDASANGMWITEELNGAGGDSLLSTHSDIDSNSLFNHPPDESSYERAPAERPLSPACGHTNPSLTANKLSNFSVKLKYTRYPLSILPIQLQNTQQGVSINSCKERQPCFAAQANRIDFSNSQLDTLPPKTPITQNGCKIPSEPHNIPKHSGVKAKISVLSQEGTGDSLSYIMDQVDRQAATASLLQGKPHNISLRPLENKKPEDNKREVEKERSTCVEMAVKVDVDEDIQLSLSHLELPQAKSIYPHTSDAMTTTNHTERRKDMCCAKYDHCGIGMMKPSIPEVMLVSFQDKENNQKPQTTPAEGLGNKPPECQFKSAYLQTSVIPSSVQKSGRTGSPSSPNLMINGATHMPPEYPYDMPSKLVFSISTPPSECVLGQLYMAPKQDHAEHSNHPSNSNISLQPNSLLESNSQESNQQITPIQRSMLEDLDHWQWCVVQAHWKQLEEMQALYHKEGTLLCQQPDMAFGEYVHKLEDILERKAQCVHNMIVQLQSYLKPSYSNQPYDQDGNNHDPVTLINQVKKQ